jgi:uncharacterized protein (TIGR03086 family)
MQTSLFPEPADVLFDDDPRAVFARALAVGAGVIGAVRPDQLAAATPCGEYDVRRLLAHLVGVVRYVEVMGRGEETFLPATTDDMDDDGWSAAWLDAAHDVRDAWTDDANLTRVIRLPWADLSGAATLAVYASEITVHTWDLATATGQTPSWDQSVLEVAFDAIRVVLPPEPRGGFVPFDEVVVVPSGAPLIDQLVAWTGRQPRR